jgi:hypothetical protein
VAKSSAPQRDSPAKARSSNHLAGKVTRVTVHDLKISTQDPPVTLSPPGPWPVIGNVTANGTLLNMAYQVGADGPVNSFPPPNGTPGQPTPFSFFLTSQDLQSNGTFTLYVYAWDDEDAPDNFGSQPATIVCEGFGSSGSPPGPGGIQP